MTRRVLLALSGGRILGGAERSLLSLLTRLPAHEWEVVLATPSGPLASRAAESGVAVTPVRWRDVRPISVKTAGAKRYSTMATAAAVSNTLLNGVRLAQLARTVDATVVMSNSLSTHLMAAVAGKLVPRALTVWYLREIVDPGRGTRVLERAGRSVDLLISISDAVSEAIRHPRIVKVPQSIELPDVVPARQPAGVRPRIGYLGRLDPAKGVEDVCGAAEFLDADFLLAGAPLVAPAGYVDRLRSLAASIAPGRIRFCGEVPEPWSFLAGIDVLVVPSRREPWGRVAAEAQIMGVPVVAANAGGLREIVTDGVDGLLYPPGRIDVLVDRLRQLLDDDELRDGIAKNAKQRASRFDPDIDAGAVAGVLEEALLLRSRKSTG